MTKEQVYKAQMKELGIYDPVLDPEISILAQIERDYTRAKKEHSATAEPGEKPSLLDPHYAVVQKLRDEMLRHREALGLTAKALAKLRPQSDAGPTDKEQIAAKLDLIASRVASYDDLPEYRDAAAISEMLDADYDLTAAVAEDMG